MIKKNGLCLIAAIVLTVASLLVLFAGCTTETGDGTGNTTPGETPVATPNGVDSSLLFLSKRGYISGAGCPTVVGELRNVGNSTVVSILLTASFHCSKGRLIGAKENVAATISAHPERDRLAPGETSPFKAAISREQMAKLWNFDVDKMEKYSVEIAGYEVVAGPPLYSAFEVTESEGTLNADGYYHSSGTLRNAGNLTADAVRVIGTFYDDEGRLIDVAHCDLEGTLPPGAEAEFDISVSDEGISQRIETYRIHAVEYEEPG